MAGEKKTYPVFSGLIQQFGDNPAVVTRDANGQSVRDVTIKAVGSQKLIRLTVWPEYAGVEFGKGYKMEGEGALTVSEGKDGKTYYNISVSTLLPPIAPLPKADKQVVNATAAAAGSEDEDAPF